MPRTPDHDATTTPERYEMRELDNGWSVWDHETNAPAVVDGRWPTGLQKAAAFELARLLNIYGGQQPDTTPPVD